MTYYVLINETTIQPVFYIVVGNMTITNPSLEILRENGCDAYEVIEAPLPPFDEVNQYLEARYKIEDGYIVKYYIVKDCIDVIP